MPATTYDYVKQCDAGRLRKEIDGSTITIGVDSIKVIGAQTSVTMKAELSAGEVTTLNGIVGSHINTPLEENVAQPVKIEEGDSGVTGGHTLVKGFHVPVNNQGWNEFDITFPFPVAIFSATWNNDAVNFADDMIELYVAPNTQIGQPTADIAISDVTFSVPQSVIDNVAIGYYITLIDALDSNHTFECGRVIAISQGNMTITIETAAAEAWTAATTIIAMTIKVADEIHINGNGIEVAGSSKIGGSPVPANTIIRARYYSDQAPPSNYIFHFRLQLSY